MENNEQIGYMTEAPVLEEEKYTEEPVSTVKYWVITALMMLPGIGLLLMLVWSFGGTNKKNIRNLSRAMLINVVLGIVCFLLVGIILKSAWDKSGLQDTVDKVGEVVKTVDFEKLGAIANSLDEDSLEAIMALQKVDPKVLQGLAQIGSAVPKDETTTTLSADQLLEMVQNLQGIDMGEVSRYLEDPGIQEFMKNPELLEKLGDLAQIKDAVDLEKAAELLGQLENLESILGTEKYNELQNYLNGQK